MVVSAIFLTSPPSEECEEFHPSPGLLLDSSAKALGEATFTNLKDNCLLCCSLTNLLSCLGTVILALQAQMATGSPGVGAAQAGHQAERDQLRESTQSCIQAHMQLGCSTGHQVGCNQRREPVQACVQNTFGCQDGRCVGTLGGTNGIPGQSSQ